MKQLLKYKSRFSLFIVGMFITGYMLPAKHVEARIFGNAVQETDATRNSCREWVYNSDNVSHSVGSVVVWKDSTSFDGLEVSTTVVANNPMVAGVVVDKTIAASDWGFIQTCGYYSAIKIGVSNSAGDALVTSTTGEKAGVYSVAQATGTISSATVKQAKSFGVFAVAFEATATSTTLKGLLYR